MLQKDVELKKIEILDSDFHSFIGFLYSIVIGFFLSISIFLAILRYQNLLSYPIFILSMIILLTFVVFLIFYLRNKRKNHLILMSNLLNRIENHESLPSLEILQKQTFW